MIQYRLSAGQRKDLLIRAIYDADLWIACREESGYSPDTSGLDETSESYNRVAMGVATNRRGDARICIIITPVSRRHRLTSSGPSTLAGPGIERIARPD